jgi:hypothetical protein
VLVQYGTSAVPPYQYEIGKEGSGEELAVEPESMGVLAGTLDYPLFTFWIAMVPLRCCRSRQTVG